MRPILQGASAVALLILTIPSILFLAGRLELDQVKWIMLLATIVWFVTATPWMWSETRRQEPEKDEIIVP
jgi:succinate dehydrogenase hydrophobic anchor subunit